MNTLLTTVSSWFIMRFWASPYSSMAGHVSMNDVWTERMMQKLKSYDPGFPRDDPPPKPPTPARPFPTDVPAPEPHDVPAPEPVDVPPPDPGEEPAPAKTPKKSGQDLRPRPIP